MDYDSLTRETPVPWIGQAPHQELQPGAHPLAPANDPFYEPPAGFQHALPGTVLRSRDVELAFLGLIPQRLHATQLLYRSSDRYGLPQAAVTTVLVPAESNATGARPIVSYQCAIDGVDARAFPSYALRRRAGLNGSFTQLEFVLIAALLEQGWAVSVPDHEGRHGHWGAPYEPGYVVLDGIRAAQASDRLDVAFDAPVGMWGYSGGGLATAWAAEVSADYAPELNIAGTALGSPVGDLGNTLRRLDGSFWSGLPAMMIAALTHSYPDLDQVVQEHATADGRALMNSLESMTTGTAVLKMHHRTLNDYIDRPLDELIATAAVQHVFDDTRLGSTAPSCPVLLFQATHDQVISVDDIDALADAYAAGGTRLTYHRDQISEHILLHPLSTPMVLEWLRDRFAGRPIASGAVRSGWPALLNPKTYLGLARLGLIAVRVITGRAAQHSPH
ncbi:lipase [Mycobacterium sp. M1]|uniref:Lipase n=1 Tax=Mycolicibacter acidiphilus TaxID=2835306 RepID=A0ABS5RJ28_9MYCO|nr:lipase family protein [Mycolicibacter acidiphilus]MBS9534303.1 lipase [Mycolicibacter acidiphilus]